MRDYNGHNVWVALKFHPVVDSEKISEAWVRAHGVDTYEQAWDLHMKYLESGVGVVPVGRDFIREYVRLGGPWPGGGFPSAESVLGGDDE